MSEIQTPKPFIDPSETKAYKAAVVALKKLPLSSKQEAYSDAASQELESRFCGGLTKAKRSACILGIVGRKCIGATCSCRPPGDHGALWLKDGVPHCYIAQPYWLPSRVLLQAVEFAAANGLELEINGNDSFHRPSNSFLMIYRKAKAI